MPDASITLIGNLVENPVLRITASGVSVCGFRLASTPRRFDRTEQRFVDGNTLYLRVSCWRQLAENVAASLSRGDRALVVGRLRQNNYETQEGDRRVSYEVDAEAVAAELTWRPVEVRRVARSESAAAGSPAAPADTEGYPDPLADGAAVPGDPFGPEGAGLAGPEGVGLAGTGPGGEGESASGLATVIPLGPREDDAAFATVESPGESFDTAEPGRTHDALAGGSGAKQSLAGDGRLRREGTGGGRMKWAGEDGGAGPARGAVLGYVPAPPVSASPAAGGGRGRTGEGPIGLADVVGELRLLGLGAAFGWPPPRQR